MLHRTSFNFILHLVLKNKLIFHTYKTLWILNHRQYKLYVNYPYLQRNHNFIIQKRWKNKKIGQHEDDDSEAEQDEEDEEKLAHIDDYLKTKHSKIINVIAPSPRLDAIAKVGFGMSRAKIEKAFYESKLRVNGKKCLKKSIMVNTDDEIDLIINKSDSNSAFLTVHRCIVLEIEITEEGYSKIKILRNKSLLIPDYDDRRNVE